MSSGKNIDDLKPRSVYRRWRVLFTLARQPSVVRRAIRVGLVVGTVLVVINYGDGILAGDIGLRELIKIGVTYLVPYCVCTYGCVTAMSGDEDEQRPMGSESGD